MNYTLLMFVITLKLVHVDQNKLQPCFLCIICMVLRLFSLEDALNLYELVRARSELAQQQANEAYKQSLAIYVDTDSIELPTVDVEGLKEEANDIKIEVIQHGQTFNYHPGQVIVYWSILCFPGVREA